MSRWARGEVREAGSARLGCQLRDSNTVHNIHMRGGGGRPGGRWTMQTTRGALVHRKGAETQSHVTRALQNQFLDRDRPDSRQSVQKERNTQIGHSTVSVSNSGD